MSQNALLSTWASSLWTASWQGLLFVAAVWGVCAVFRSLPASTKAWLWWLAALKLLVGLMWVGVELPWLPAAETSPLAKLNHRLDLMAPKIIGHTGGRPADAGSTAALQKPATPEDGASWTLLILPGLWALGVVGIAGGVVAQGAKMHGLRRRAVSADTSKPGQVARELGAKMGLSRRPTVLSSGEVSAPMVAGILRPALFLPVGLEAGLDDSELRLCIAHELAHIRRRDLPFAIVPTLMQVAFFFFPPAWLIRREWEIEREAACDAEALAITSASPAAYGRLLMKIVVNDHRGALTPALGATASYHTLKKRIVNITHLAPTRRRMKILATGVGILALVLAIPWQVTSRAAAAEVPVGENNVVVNGGFEESTATGPVGWTRQSLPPDTDVPVSIAYNEIKDGDPPRVLAMRHDGHHSISFTKTEQSFYPVSLLAQTIPYKGQARVKVSLWAKAEGARKFALAVMMNGAGEGKIEWGAYIGDADSSKPITHDWKQYSNVIDIPRGTTDITLALEMYGPGIVYVDDVSASYEGSGDAGPEPVADPLADVKDVSNEDLRAGGDPMKRYFLIGATGPEPANGYKLLIVMPGGDGSADFNPFVRRIWKNALPEGYAIAELVAPQWSARQFDTIVWPTRDRRWEGMKFATEDFVDAVVKDVARRHKVDAAHVYSLAWSSGGQAAYTAALGVSAIRGSFVAMSIFAPDRLPALSNARGRGFYIYSSPDDNLVDFSNATRARTDLLRAGANATLATYQGGHGWHGDVYGDIRKGVEWLDAKSGS